MNVLERRIGQDLALINAESQSVCILDKNGERVWNFFKKKQDLFEVRKKIEVPPEEQKAFSLFCDELEKFLKGEVRDPSQGPSLHQYFYENGIPLVLGLEINTRCQLRCRHCYNPQRYPLGEKDKKHLDLPVIAVESLASDLGKLGTPFVIITGGEPLLHPQFLQICRILVSSGIALKVFTNGYELSPETADALAEMKIFLVGFTLFGHTAESHEFISQVSGSFERIVQAIRFVSERNIPVDVTFFLMKHNFAKRYEMGRWANEELRIKPSFSFSITPRETGDLFPFELEISSQQMKTFFEEEGIARETLQCGDETMIPCTAGKTLAAVKANGDVTPCISFLYPVGNIFGSSFLDVWQKSRELRKFRTLKLGDITGCHECSLKNICLRCFVNAHILGKDIFGRDPHACRVAGALHLAREKIRGKEVSNETPKCTAH